jgi:hypothetical protein
MTPPTVKLTVEVVVTKDWGTFGGPDMWNLHIKRPSDGFPESVQWMGAGNVENLLDIKLPRYKITRGKLKEIKP